MHSPFVLVIHEHKIKCVNVASSLQNQRCVSRNEEVETDRERSKMSMGN